MPIDADRSELLLSTRRHPRQLLHVSGVHRTGDLRPMRGLLIRGVTRLVAMQPTTVLVLILALRGARQPLADPTSADGMAICRLEAMLIDWPNPPR